MIGFIVFGLIVGIVARLLVPGRQNMSLLATLLVGVAGSVVGGLVANTLGTGDTFELNFIGAIAAFASAALLIVFVEKSGVADRRTA